ncbi:hypothetical protein NQ315_012866 [Exocentrus adspersus]|uniref:Uncharacterized protein n=1 Tax=Exocentrus adspersus TaxID=1586481 RepID=A0AAV8VGC7_9CUCU|nr:hypothetical protein NQ315_012866 [Exocentrus adspersus]
MHHTRKTSYRLKKNFTANWIEYMRKYEASTASTSSQKPGDGENKNNRIARLRTKKEKVEYERNLKVELESISNNTGENKTIEDSWEELKTKLEMTAKICNRETKKRKKEWFDEECKGGTPE